MRWFKKLKIRNVMEEIERKNRGKRYFMLIMGSLIVAFAFNLFFLNYNIVCFGVSGLAIVFSQFGIDPSIFILVSNVILLIVAYFVLGPKDVKNQVVGAFVYPIFVEATSLVTRYIDLGNMETIVVAIFGGVLAGIGYGLIYKSSFSTGGTDVIISIICKFCKISMGKAGLIVNGVIIIIGKIVFSWDIILYAILVSYLISIFTDKVLLGISKSKAFYIVANKENNDVIKDFLLSLSKTGITVIDAKGGFSNGKQVLFLAVVPSRNYFLVKEGLRQIDKNIFFLVCDAYEVSEREAIL